MAKIGFIFPGQGSQYPGMGKEIYENFNSAKEVFDRCEDTIGIPLKKLCFEGPAEELKKTEITQPAILTVSMAIWKILSSEGIKPIVCAGHSLGEYSAYVSAGYFSYEDGIKLVRERGLLMSGADPEGKGGMAAILGMTDEEINSLCKEASSDGIVVPANFNCPGQIVISGEKQAVKKAANIASSKGKKAIILEVGGAFHSPLIQDASDKFKTFIQNFSLNKSDIPVISNTVADITPFENIKESLVKQLTSSVLWTKSMEKMISMGVDVFVEVGPGKVLQGFVKKIDRKIKTYGIEDKTSLENALKELK